MQRFILDAFNITRSGAVRRLADAKDEYRELIYFISENRLTGSPRNAVTIVFDGYEPDGFRNPQPRLQVRFSNNQKADDVICRLVAAGKNNGSVTVVSNDREIRDSVRSHGARVMSCEEFLSGGRKQIVAGGDDKKLDSASSREITDELGQLWLGGDE